MSTSTMARRFHEQPQSDDLAERIVPSSTSTTFVFADGSTLTVGNSRSPNGDINPTEPTFTPATVAALELPGEQAAA